MIQSNLVPPIKLDRFFKLTVRTKVDVLSKSRRPCVKPDGHLIHSLDGPNIPLSLGAQRPSTLNTIFTTSKTVHFGLDFWKECD